MKRNQFRIILVLLTMTMSGIVGFAVSIGNPLLAVSAVFAGMAAMYLCKRKLEGVVEDERICRVGQMASRASLQVVALGFALGGTILIAMRNTYPNHVDLGFFLGYASCGILVLYSLFYIYFNKEYGV